MKIGIIGFGYVGSALAYGLKKFGHEIKICDIDKEKIKTAKRSFKATEKVENLLDSEIIFICVPTPSKKDGSCDTSIVENVVIELANKIKKRTIIVIKSTIIPGTTDKLITKNKNSKISILVNPEFLRAKTALKDFLTPDRIVIGGYDRRAMKVLAKIYEPFNTPIVLTEPKIAEMVKYASNAFLATKVSFANQIKLICDKLKINSKEVMKIVTMDHRIHPSHLDPTKGPYEGPCLPKDILALIKKAKEVSSPIYLLEGVEKINNLLKFDQYNPS